MDAYNTSYGGGDGTKYLKTVETRLSCSDRCSQRSIIAANSLFLIVALSIVGLASYGFTSQYANLAGHAAVGGVLGGGVYAVIVALLGISGASCKNRPALRAYNVLMFICCGVMIAGGSYLFSKVGHEGDLITTGWGALNNDARLKVENSFNCCGLNNFNDTVGLPCPTGSTQACLGTLVNNLKHPLFYIALTSLVLGVFLIATIFCSVGMSGNINPAVDPRRSTIGI